MLAELSKAPLKPYQRLEILKTFAIPKLTHELVLGNAHRNTLRKMDVLVRTAVRGWLRLPKDTPLGYLHATIPDGGIGIPCLTSIIPVLQRTRYTKILSNTSEVTAMVRQQKSFEVLQKSINIPIRIGPATVTTKSEDREAWRDHLFNSIDGKDLNTSLTDKSSHYWLLRPQNVFPRLHLRGIQLRGGVLPTKSRRARGVERAVTNVLCQGACRQTETLNHILQRCERTHDVRCARHNCVMRRADQMLRKKNWQTWVEPIVTTDSSFIKLDILALKDNSLLVIDVSIVSGSHLQTTWDIKIKKYGSTSNEQAIQKWVDPINGVLLQHLPLVISNRGLFYEPSGRGLRSCGLTNRDISDLCLLTIAGSLKIYDYYTRST